MTLLGSDVYSWRVEATLRATGSGDPSAELVGNTTVDFLGGWANFTNLMIDISGTYIIDFNIVYPNEASHFSISSQTVTVAAQQLKGRVVTQPSAVVKDAPFNVEVDLLNSVTGRKIGDIAWRVR